MRKTHLFLALILIAIFMISSCMINLNNEDIKKRKVTDIDGNVYEIVKIGNQWWMAENLKVTHYRNGNPIPNVISYSEWENLTTGVYCSYDNSTSHMDTYGCFYNWYAVNDSRNIAPEGWHVPSDAEWQTLVDYLGGDAVAGGKLKETGFLHWSTPNTGTTNESGFTALPGGYLWPDEGCVNLGFTARFWSITENYDIFVWNRSLFFWDSVVSRGYDLKTDGYSIRCIKD